MHKNPVARAVTQATDEQILEFCYYTGVSVDRFAQVRSLLLLGAPSFAPSNASDRREKSNLE